MKIKLIFYSALCFVQNVAIAETSSLERIVVSTDGEELLIANIWDRVQELLSKRELLSTLKFPKLRTSTNHEYYIFSMSFHITKNEQRGYELVIPKYACSENGPFYLTKTSMKLKTLEFKQGIAILILE